MLCDLQRSWSVCMPRFCCVILINPVPAGTFIFRQKLFCSILQRKQVNVNFDLLVLYYIRHFSHSSITSGFRVHFLCAKLHFRLFADVALTFPKTFYVLFCSSCVPKINKVSSVAWQNGVFRAKWTVKVPVRLRMRSLFRTFAVGWTDYWVL